MASDFSHPLGADAYAALLAYIRDNQTALAKLLDGTGTLNIPAGAIRWSSANSRLEKYDGSAWAALCALYAINVQSLQGYVPADFALVGHNHSGAYQPLDADLTAFAGLSSGADKFPYFTAAGAMSTISIVSAIRTLLTQTSVANFRSAAGLAIGTNVQAYHANLAALAGLTGAANKFPFFTAAGAMSMLSIASAIRTLLGSADLAAFRSNLGLGSAALLAAGTASGNVPILAAASKLPALDGSLLTGLTASQISGLVSGGLKGLVIFSTAGSQSWTVPDGVTSARVRCVGGGGGSGGVYNYYDSNAGPISGGGGGGGYSEKIITGLTPGSSITVTVGAGGAAGAGGSGATNGGTGGTSSFGAHVTAPGGAGSAKVTAPTVSSPGAAGGAPSTSGALNIPGEAGLTPAYSYAGTPYVLTVTQEPYGGRSELCLAATRATRAAGTAYGQGAGGAVCQTQQGTVPGYAGAPGVVIVEY